MYDNIEKYGQCAKAFPAGKQAPKKFQVAVKQWINVF